MTHSPRREALGLLPHDRLLHVGDVRHAHAVRHGDLTVEDQLSAEPGDAVERGAEELRPVISVATDEAEPALAVGDNEEAAPVVLQLMQPAVAGRRLGGGGADGGA
jgi:hypothetical protein